MTQPYLHVYLYGQNVSHTEKVYTVHPSHDLKKMQDLHNHSGKITKNRIHNLFIYMAYSTCGVNGQTIIHERESERGLGKQTGEIVLKNTEGYCALAQDGMSHAQE